jgi:hypothetical protein
MATTYTHTIIDKRIEGDTLVTDISIQFSGDFNEEVLTTIYHFRPQTIEEIESNIEIRINTELQKLQARDTMQDLINQL